MSEMSRLQSGIQQVFQAAASSGAELALRHTKDLEVSRDIISAALENLRVIEGNEVAQLRESLREFATSLV